MTKWPSTIPHDLDNALNQLTRQRAEAANSDVWGVVQDWLQHQRGGKLRRGCQRALRRRTAIDVKAV